LSRQRLFFWADGQFAVEETVMLRYMAALFVPVGLVILSGCSAKDVGSLPEELLPSVAAAALEDGTDFELLSLEPNGGEETEGENRFHGFEILGALAIEDPATQAEIMAAFKRGIADNTEQIVAACFAPRHGVRVSHEGKVHDFVICFECYITTWYVDGERAGNMNPTNVGQPVFDRVLRDAGIRLPKPAGP